MTTSNYPDCQARLFFKKWGTQQALYLLLDRRIAECEQCPTNQTDSRFPSLSPRISCNSGMTRRHMLASCGLGVIPTKRSPFSVLLTSTYQPSGSLPEKIFGFNNSILPHREGLPRILIFPVLFSSTSQSVNCCSWTCCLCRGQAKYPPTQARSILDPPAPQT
jgi:hypothetical protein